LSGYDWISYRNMLPVGVQDLVDKAVRILYCDSTGSSFTRIRHNASHRRAYSWVSEINPPLPRNLVVEINAFVRIR
jgi:hypothetical protein